MMQNIFRPIIDMVNFQTKLHFTCSVRLLWKLSCLTNDYRDDITYPDFGAHPWKAHSWHFWNFRQTRHFFFKSVILLTRYAAWGCSWKNITRRFKFTNLEIVFDRISHKHICYAVPQYLIQLDYSTRWNYFTAIQRSISLHPYHEHERETSSLQRSIYCSRQNNKADLEQHIQTKKVALCSVAQS